ncbi:hypothetical protein GDN83_09370 [Gordonia jinghuaiqii]|uniref:Capsular polysaccharide biosynthesis protein n=1 Tax=Gordonia jinghuaiqii TaxID=2758710 RepID=A0A7D7R4A3_9ACTN|nr:hypothetical protein [Gordonia jinghuaiqii]MCR5977939.1 hypothetical protein [Gordonia jinghuaiqii]QMT02592.1 hypothetical protein H1R19_05430 [Gordonia jinghuaiqii]
MMFVQRTSRRFGVPTPVLVFGVLGCLGLIVAVAVSTFAAQNSMVQATSRVVLTYERDALDQPGDFDPTPTMLLTKSIESYSSLVTSENFLRRVIDTHDIAMTTGELRSAVSITSPRDTTIMDFTVRGEDSRVVEAAALGIGREFTAALAELEAPSPIESLVLAPVEVDRTFPNALLRTTVLGGLAALTTVLLAVMFVRRRSHSHSPLTTHATDIWRTR